MGEQPLEDPRRPLDGGFGRQHRGDEQHRPVAYQRGTVADGCMDEDHEHEASERKGEEITAGKAAHHGDHHEHRDEGGHVEGHE